MADTPATNAVTEVPAPKGGGFPPFKTETFPSQLFWLAITFTFLFVVLWRVAGPRIQGTIAARRGKIEGDLASAEMQRKDAEAASAAYQAALGAARLRAQGVAEENRKRLATEIERAKTLADAEAQKATATAETRIATMRTEARGHMIKAASEAAIAIVQRLTGEPVSPDEAAAVVRSTDGG